MIEEENTEQENEEIVDEVDTQAGRSRCTNNRTY